MTSAFSWQNSISLCPASFHIPRPNLPVTSGVSWLPTFAFQSPIMKIVVYIFPGGTRDKEPVCQCRRCKRCRFVPCVEKIPRRRTWQLTPLFLPGELHEQRSLAAYSPWGHIELDTTEWLTRQRAMYPEKHIYISKPLISRPGPIKYKWKLLRLLESHR